MHRNRHPDAGIRARQLLEHQDVGEEVRARSAVFLRDARAHQPQLGKLAEQLARKVMVTIPLGRVRIDLGVRKIARERLDLPLVLRKVEVHFARDDTWAPFLRATPACPARV